MPPTSPVIGKASKSTSHGGEGRRRLIAPNLDPPGTCDMRDEVIARYLSTSAGIHRRADAADHRAFIRAYRWHLRDWLPADTSLPWLDLGCGQGQLMSLARDVGFRTIVGVDMSQELLAGCRE